MQSVSLPDPDNNHLQLFDKNLKGECPTCAPAPGGATAPPPANPLFKPRMYSHVGITVADLKRAKDFYCSIFDLPPKLRPLAPPASSAYALDFAGQFISLTSTSARGSGDLKPGVITHFGIAVDNFSAERDGEKLAKAGYQVQVSSEKKDLVESISVVDPDGLHIRISDANYTYQCPTCKSSPA
jgi:catechol 2,3-dioxygenase-like lactoylglutathione lyase family enzyme